MGCIIVGLTLTERTGGVMAGLRAGVVAVGNVEVTTPAPAAAAPGPPLPGRAESDCALTSSIL